MRDESLELRERSFRCSTAVRPLVESGIASFRSLRHWKLIENCELKIENSFSSGLSAYGRCVRLLKLLGDNLTEVILSQRTHRSKSGVTDVKNAERPLVILQRSLRCLELC